MTIEQTQGGFMGFDIECNICGTNEYLDFDWENFRAAVADAKERGWKIYKNEDGEWCHKCPECVKQGE